jgi:hypothetical protein
MITDFTDAVGTPIVPGNKVAVAVIGGRYSKCAALRIGHVYRVGLHSIGVNVEVRQGRTYPRSYRTPKNFIVLK